MFALSLIFRSYLLKTIKLAWHVHLNEINILLDCLIYLFIENNKPSFENGEYDVRDESS